MEKSKKEKITLSANVRDVVGKKVKKLRESGKLPGNVFGEGFTSQSIWVLFPDFLKTYKLAGETQVVYVHVGSDEYPTLIDTVQKHPISGDLLHVDFKKVSLKKKIETEVPIVFTGESVAVEKNKGDMLTLKDVLLVRALPDAIPTQIDVDISVLAEIDDEITVATIKKSDDFEIVDEPETVIVRIAEHKEESVEPDTTSELPEAEGEEGADGVDVEAEATTEGEKATEESDTTESDGSSDEKS